MRWLLLLTLAIASCQSHLTLFEKRAAPILAIQVPEITPNVWATVKEYEIGIDVPEHVLHPRETLKLKVVHDGKRIVFLLRWKDETESREHKPWVWSKKEKKYIKGPEREDVAFLAFELEGRFNVNMVAGIESKWDVWQWKAFRTDPLGYATDKMHIYTRFEPKGKSKMVKCLDGKPGWIQRLEDRGKRTAKKIPAPEQNEGDRLPSYVPQVPNASAADVRAKGTWKNGEWTLILSREMHTVNQDDTNFKPGYAYGLAVGVLREAEDDAHFTSRPYTLRLEKKD